MYVRPQAGCTTFGARAIQARYGPSWAKASIRVGETSSVRAADTDGAVARKIPTKAPASKMTPRRPANLKTCLSIERA